MTMRTIRTAIILSAAAAALASAHLGPLEVPEAGASYKAGARMEISWSVLVEHGTQDLAYSTDGATWTNIVTGLALRRSTYSWTVPNAPGNKVRVRVCQRDGGNGCTNAHNTTSETTFPVPGGEVYTMVSGNFTIQASTALGPVAADEAGAGARRNAAYGSAGRYFAWPKAGKALVFDTRGRSIAR